MSRKPVKDRAISLIKEIINSNENEEGKMKCRFLLSLAIVFILLFCPFLVGAEKDRLTIDLFLDWEYVNDPQISADGSQIVYTRVMTDKMNDTYESHIWIVNFDGSRERKLCDGSSPRWSPDGKRLAYIAAHEKRPQIFVRWMDTGGTTQITRLNQGPRNLVWSPDGKKIAFNMFVPYSPTPMIKMPPMPKGAKWAPRAQVESRLVWRNDRRGNRPFGYTHIFTVPSTGGTPRQLTSGDFDYNAPDWSPDGQTIIFNATREAEADYEVFADRAEVYALSLKDGRLKALTDRVGPDLAPKFSPDGRYIAYSGFDQKKYMYHVSNLYIMSSNGQNSSILAGKLDRSIRNFTWAPDSKGLYFTAGDKGSSNLHFVPTEADSIKQITKGEQMISSLCLSKNNRAVATLTSPHEPGDLVAFSPQKPVLKKITGVNDDILEGVKLGDVEEIWYKSFDGLDIQGWIVKPPDFDPNKKYPLMLQIHGGPNSMYNVGFNFEFQNHAANGYVVLYTNPRGSTGYGEEFGNAIQYAYPKDDYKDLMKGVDAMIEKGYIDEDNLFACGGSGGGVLTSWIVGHTDRFCAAVVMKPVINWHNFYGTTDIASWAVSLFRKMPWEDPDEYLERSPLSYVGNVTTPTMIMTGEMDLRTPMEQSEQYYRALKLQKKEAVMVRIQGEYHGFNHFPSHPTNKMRGILYLRQWFDDHRKE